MGFFDSLSKKKPEASFSEGLLPPPPMPEIKSPMPPPPAPPNFNPSPPIIVAAPQLTKEPKALPLIRPPAEIKKAAPEPKNVFSLPALPKKTDQQKEFVKLEMAPLKIVSPEALPQMPRLARESRAIPEKNDELEEFSDVYEEVPFFSEPSATPDLPVLDISDSEEHGNIKPVLNTADPLFIRTDHYSNVLSTIDTINDYIALSSDTIYSLENLKKNEEVEHKGYKELMEDIQRKLIYIDKLLFEKGVQ